MVRFLFCQLDTSGVVWEEGALIKELLILSWPVVESGSFWLMINAGRPHLKGEVLPSPHSCFFVFF